MFCHRHFLFSQIDKCISECEVKESKCQIENNWKSCQQMFDNIAQTQTQTENQNQNVDSKSKNAPKSEKANLEILTKFEQLKKQTTVLGKAHVYKVTENII